MQQDIQQLTQSELFEKVGFVCAIVNTVTNETQLLDESLLRTMKIFGAMRGSIFIMDPCTGDLILKSAIGLQWAEKDQLVKKMGEGVVGRVAALKKPIFVEDLSVDDRFKGFKPRQSYHTSSFICAPLIIKDELVGVINMADKESGRSFGESEVQLLDFLASQIALNYRRIELYQKLKVVLKQSKDLKDELGKSSEETSLLKSQMLAHEKLATLGKLAGGIAHEFNNPLDGVMRYTNLCLNQVGEDDVLRGYLLEIKQGLNRMANVVRSLLACSRGEVRGDVQKVDPNKAVLHAVEGLKISLSQKNIQLEEYLAAGLPLIADFGLERIVENLLRNAIDAINGEGRIVIKTSFDAGNFILVVEDNGPGLDGSKEDFSKIFQPFYTTKESDRGCGLGLTIVSEVVKAYDGNIHIESAPGRGVIFTITLPIEV